MNQDQSAFPDVNDPVLHAIEARNVDASDTAVATPKTMEAVKAPVRPLAPPLQPPVAAPVQKPASQVAPQPVTSSPASPPPPVVKPVAATPVPPPVAPAPPKRQTAVVHKIYPTFDYFASQPKAPMGKKVAVTVVIVAVVVGIAASWYFFLR